MLPKDDIARYTKRLHDEKTLLEKELSTLGSRNPSNPSDWVPSLPKGDEYGADRNDNADIREDMDDNNAALNQLEGRLNLVTKALEKVESGTYGTCETCGDDIETDRLDANPAATTCKAHMSDL